MTICRQITNDFLLFSLLGVTVCFSSHVKWNSLEGDTWFPVWPSFLVMALAVPYFNFSARIPLPPSTSVTGQIIIFQSSALKMWLLQFFFHFHTNTKTSFTLLPDVAWCFLIAYCCPRVHFFSIHSSFCYLPIICYLYCSEELVNLAFMTFVHRKWFIIARWFIF